MIKAAEGDASAYQHLTRDLLMHMSSPEGANACLLVLARPCGCAKAGPDDGMIKGKKEIKLVRGRHHNMQECEV
jgi:hypothetical protein